MPFNFPIPARVGNILLLACVALQPSCQDGRIGHAAPEAAGRMPAPAAAASAAAALPRRSRIMPAEIANGSTISLDCGTMYFGTLDLAGKSGVTIHTAGTCATAILTPARPVSRWRRYKGDIYVADVPDRVAQVFVDGKLMEEAHYPNSVAESGWLQPIGTTEHTIVIRQNILPDHDIVGARATFRSWKWQLGTRFVTSFDGETIHLSAPGTPGAAFEDTPPGNFYLEGKLWMLDSPGEWAWRAGQLYVYLPDRADPGRRVLAAPDVDAVNASRSSHVTLERVRILGGKNGVNGSETSGLTVRNVALAYSNKAGIALPGADAGVIDNVDVTHAARTGIDGGWWSTNVSVRNSRITDTNMAGMHKGSEGEIFFGDGSGMRVINNTILRGGKTGIFMGRSRHALVKGNTIDGACLIHADCGGIYTYARHRRPLDTRIEDNKVSNVNGDAIGSGSAERYGIYLDDSSNGVTVLGNTVSNCATGMLIHGGFNNIVSGNRFSASRERHLLFSDSGFGSGMIFGNKIMQNTFEGPQPAYAYHAAAEADIPGFATYIGNRYQSYAGADVGGPAPSMFEEKRQARQPALPNPAR